MIVTRGLGIPATGIIVAFGYGIGSGATPPIVGVTAIACLAMIAASVTLTMRAC